MAELLCQLDSLDETIARFDEEIQRYCDPFEPIVELLDTIPGVGRTTAEMIVSEIGVDMSRFPSASHLAPRQDWLQAIMRVQVNGFRVRLVKATRLFVLV